MTTNAAISPDGRWLAYTSRKGAGRDEVWARPFPDVKSGEHQVSFGGGLAPVWSADGTELFYQGAGGLMALPIIDSTTFERGVASVVFTMDDYVQSATVARRYDYDAADDRFLMLKRGQGRLRPVVVLNFLDLLEALIPTP